MIAEELVERLADYDSWKDSPPAGWRTMLTLNLRGPVELLFDDGRIERHAPCISHAVWMMDQLDPVAWCPADA
jgi:hypothetical protein